MNRQCRLILASGSPRRKELIRILGLPVQIIASQADEHTEEDMSPRRKVETLALRKARAVFQLSSREEGIVIGADTVVAVNDKVLGKPVDRHDAVRMLCLLEGRTHQVYSGVACIDTATGRELVRSAMTQVTFKPLTREQIERYADTNEPMDKAGAYAVQGLASVFIEKIEGDFFNVVGLPLSLLSDMLFEFGIRVL